MIALFQPDSFTFVLGEEILSAVLCVDLITAQQLDLCSLKYKLQLL